MDIDVPLLLPLTDFKENNSLLHDIDNRWEFLSQGTSFPVKYKNGYSILGWRNSSILFTATELNTLHLQFLQPPTD